MLVVCLRSSLNTATYDAANQQLVLGNKSATFDANGNLTTLTDPNDATTYTWNARNQLISLSGPGVTASFQYDALGRRKSKTVNSVTTDFLYDGLNLVQELSNGTPTANLLVGLGIDEVLLRTDSAGPRTFLADGLGSTLALTDASGAVQTDYTYEPFGNTAVNGASSANPAQYTGRENDGTGLYYYRARYYHPELQRFVSEDPIGFGGGDVNLYAYVTNLPTNFIDPSGLASWNPADPRGPLGGGGGGGGMGGGGRGGAFPNRPLPRDNYGRPVPESPYPHTQLGRRDGRNGSYPQAREFDDSGRPVRDMDFTDHGRRDHPNPHQHRYDPETGRRGGPEPLDCP